MSLLACPGVDFTSDVLPVLVVGGLVVVGALAAVAASFTLLFGAAGAISKRLR